MRMRTILNLYICASVERTRVYLCDGSFTTRHSQSVSAYDGVYKQNCAVWLKNLQYRDSSQCCWQRYTHTDTRNWYEVFSTSQIRTCILYKAQLSFEFLFSTGRGYSTASSTTLRRVGISVGALLAGSAVAYGGNLLYDREGSPSSLLPSVQAATRAHQPSVSEHLCSIKDVASYHL